MKKEKVYNPYFDLLRVVAIIMLIAYHTALLHWDRSCTAITILNFIARIGWIGTDMFLCLAGYLCVTSLKNKRGIPGFIHYMKNRTIRIIPSYYLFILLYLHTGQWFFNFINQNWYLRPGFEFSLWTFTSNISLSLGKGSGVALEGMFSISLGLQLFIIAGFLLTMVQSRRKIVYFLIILELIAIICRFLNLQSGTWSNYFFTLTRMDSFIGGMLISLATEHPRCRVLLQKYKNHLLIMSSLLLIIIIGATKGLSLWRVPATAWLPYPFIAFFMSSIIYLASEMQYPPKIVRFCSYFGKFTYAIYLIKLPTAYFVYTVLKLMNLENSLINLIFTFLLTEIACFTIGTLWWTVVEKPCNLLFSKLFYKTRGILSNP